VGDARWPRDRGHILPIRRERSEGLLEQLVTPGPDPRQVIAESRIGCPEVAANAPMHVECSGSDFVMTCAMNGTDAWITRTGGNDARVYIY
jgi:hypothetical protein